MLKERLPLYRELEERRQSKLVAYVTGDRRGLETQIGSEVLDLFVQHLDAMGDPSRISLLLYTRGGDTLASWSIANLIRQFCDEFEVIVPSKAHSGGTLICLSANRVIMTKQATLGPIDPSVNTPLNPQIPGAPPDARTSVSVEALNGFLEFVRESVGRRVSLSDAILKLSDQVHPLVLGQAYRARGQIRMLADKLLAQQHASKAESRELLEFLCSGSGSHDYTINRREAENLGLHVEKPDDALYDILRRLYDDIAEDLQLRVPFDPKVALGGQAQASYSFRRALVESVDVGQHVFVSEGVLVRQQVPVAPNVVQEGIRDDRRFDGWRLNNA
jgi:hypothetical protein